MRPVDKGKALKVYADYADARHDLAERIGYYCSYCEMKVYNSIEVEHILPINQGGAEVDWDNFLLSCKYCNTVKGDRNNELNKYLWPDRDNTDLAFYYRDGHTIQPAAELSEHLTDCAKNLIMLTGIDRMPGTINEPTKADTRWRSREEVWSLANISFEHWLKCSVQEMADQISNTAFTSGHYSIWITRFKGENMVIDAIQRKYKEVGLYAEVDGDGKRIVRENGKI